MKTKYSITPAVALSAILLLGAIGGCGKKEANVKDSERAGREASASPESDKVIQMASAADDPAFKSESTTTTTTTTTTTASPDPR